MNKRKPSITPEEFTQALSYAATGVNIVTTDGSGGKAGLTVSSMCSVCAEPPVVLACVEAGNEFCAAAAINCTLAVNLLSASQSELAKVFAGISPAQGTSAEASGSNRFDVGQWQTLSTGSPVLLGSLVALDCEISAAHRHGTHMVYICRVVDVQSAEQDALVYCMREFRSSAAG